jgi:hypothetical protein
MDPMLLMHLMGQLPGYGQSQSPISQMGQPQTGQLPGMMPQPQMDQQQDGQHGHHGGGLSPLMALSPMGGLFASHPKAALSMMSPAFGIANLLGAFK